MGLSPVLSLPPPWLRPTLPCSTLGTVTPTLTDMSPSAPAPVWTPSPRDWTPPLRDMFLTTDMGTTDTTERGLLMLMPRLTLPSCTELTDILTVLATTWDTLDTATPTPMALVSPPPTPPSVTPWPIPLPE